MLKFLTVAAGLSLSAAAVQAEEVRLTEDRFSAEIELPNQTITIARNQDADAVIAPDFAKTSRSCPPFCIHAMSAGEGVETVGELELIAFIENEVANGEGLLIDSRIPAWHAKGTIPGAINLPFTTVSPDNIYRDDILAALGAKQTGDTWDFANAKDLLMFCNGPWCDQSPRAIADLLDAGYPAEKLHYYRGGMQMWYLLGLTVVSGEQGPA